MSSAALEAAITSKLAETWASLEASSASSADADPLASRMLKTVSGYVSAPANALYGAMSGTKNKIEQGIAARSFDAVSNVKIGVTVPTVPPTSITIEEEKNSNEVQALRTSHSYQVKTGRGFIRIDMELAFPSEELINTELMEILGQFRASPFLTIESEYIAETVYGELDGGSPEYVEARRASKQKIDRARMQMLNARSKLAKTLEFFGVSTTTFGTLSTSDAIQYARDNVASMYPTTVLGSTTSRAETVKRYVGLEAEIKDLREAEAVLINVSREEQAKERSRAKFSYALKTIPVCLRELTVVPSPASGARLFISLVVFNHYSFSPKFLYRNSVGGWTPSIDQCPMWSWFFRRKATALGITTYKPEEKIRLTYPMLDSSQPTASLGIPARQLENTLGKGKPTDFLRYKSIDINTRDAKDSRSIVLVNTAYSMSNRIAIHPILSSQYPSLQYLGGIPAQAVLILSVPHTEVARLNTMKRCVDEVSLHPGGRKYRKGTIKIEGDGTLFCLLGLREFQIDSLITETQSPTHSQVTIRLTAFREFKADTLDFDAEKSGESDQAHVKAKLAKLFELSRKYKQLKSDNEKITALTRVTRPDPIDSIEGQAHRALWGVGNEVPHPLVDSALFVATGIVDVSSFTDLYRSSPAFKNEISDIGDRNLFRRWGREKELRAFNQQPDIGSFKEDALGAVDEKVVQDALMQWSSPTGPNPSSSLVQAYLDRLFDSPAFNGVVVRMTVLDLGGSKFPEELLKYLDESTKIETKKQELYPDLYLPTYGEVLNALLSQYLQSFSSTYGIPTDTPVDLAALPKSAEKLMMSIAGAPTHRELGHADVPENEIDLPAVGQTDFVDPDFYFFRYSARTIFNKPQDLVLDTLERFGRAGGNTETAAVPSFDSLLLASKEAGPQLVGAKMSRGIAKPTNTNIPAQTNRFFDPNTGKIGTEPVEIISNYATPTEIALNTFHDDKENDRVKNLFSHHMRSFKDDLYRMSRAFPTFKLYLIEEDEERLMLLDDWYGFNAVLDAHVTRHKWEPDLAEIQLVNILGTLDDEGFQKIGGQEDTLHQTPDAREPFTDEVRPDLVKKFPIQEGTRIVLKFGYSSNEDELETVFTGKVIEFEKGDIIALVAQGYGMELTYPVPEDSFDLPSWANKAIRMTLGIPYRHGILTLISKILSSQPAEHFGGWGLRNVLPASLGGLVVESLSRNESYEGAGPFLKTLLADPRLVNVFSSIPLEARLIRRRDDSTLNDEDRQDYWRTNGKTGLQLLRELNFHHPDMIFSIVPFDHKATLFFGRPDDEITYTDKYKREQLKDLLSQKNRTDPLLALPRLRDGSVENPFTQIATEFMRSPEHALYRQFYLEEQAEQSWLPFTGLTEERKNLHNSEIIRNLAEASHIYPDITTVVRSRVVAQEIIYELLLLKQSHGAARDVSDFGVRNAVIESARAAGASAAEIAKLQADQAIEFAAVDTPGISEVLRNKQFQIFWDEVEERTPGFVVDWSTELQDAGGNLLSAAATAPLSPGAAIAKLDLVATELAYKSFRENFSSPSAISERALLRRLMLALRDFIRRKGISGLPTSIKEISVSSFNSPNVQRKGKKPFRSYHFVDSVHHILQNNIVTSRAEMTNLVYVRGRPEKDSTSGPTYVASVDDDLLVGEYLPAFKSAPNAEFPRQVLMSAYAHLAEGMRPMYRGELIIRGNEKIKPHDVVWVLDLYNGMWGPIEVERVVHHFSYEHGFVTTIIPHLHCSVSNNITYMETTGWNILLAGSALGMAMLGVPIGGALGGWPGAAAGGMIGLGLASDFVELESGGEGIFDCLMGRGSFGRKENPVSFYPLMIQGAPFLAGLRGYNPGNAWWFSQTEKRFKLWKRGANRLGRLFSSTVTALGATR